MKGVAPSVGEEGHLSAEPLKALHTCEAIQRNEGVSTAEKHAENL